MAKLYTKVIYTCDQCPHYITSLFLEKCTELDEYIPDPKEVDGRPVRFQGILDNCPLNDTKEHI